MHIIPSGNASNWLKIHGKYGFLRDFSGHYRRSSAGLLRISASMVYSSPIRFSASVVILACTSWIFRRAGAIQAASVMRPSS